MKSVLIDTSFWVHALRRSGDPNLRGRAQRLLNEGSASWCDIVRLELWKGQNKRDDPTGLPTLESRLPSLPIDPDVWNYAMEVARAAQRGGLVIPTTDIIIFACAKVHGAGLEHNDHHYDLLATLVVKPTI